MEPLKGSPRSAAIAEGTSRLGAVVTAIIPCLDEEEPIGAVVRDILDQGVAEVIVVDGGSGDRTAERAQEARARVVVEPRRGYGRAIRRGIEAACADAAILLFLDGDGSDRPPRLPRSSARSGRPRRSATPSTNRARSFACSASSQA
jgi:glycosyltransferase involved in cell wall biosynthesis